MSGETVLFVDEYANVHERGEELGRGGQGVVFRTRDPDVAVKLALDGNGQPIPHTDFVEKLRRVRALPVPPGLHLAAPMAVLQGTAGYAMRLLNDMVPFAEFWPDPRRNTRDTGRLPEWLSAVPAELAQDLLHYRDTGGLQRRLLALYKCSAILARIHGAGLVYGDVSPANAFISRSHALRNVWLIDADSLRYETEKSGHVVYTPRFGAPELVQGIDGVRPRSDCHAFAVMAFSMLTLMHPFVGACVESGDDSDWADADRAALDMDERAYAGHLPWILDANDDCNRKDNGLVEHVLNTELMRLFQETFGPGRLKPFLRPAMFHWPLALARAFDKTITCLGCRMSYYFDFADGLQHCPYCGSPVPRMLVVNAYAWLGQPITGQSPEWQLTRVFRSISSGPRLPHRLFYPFSLIEGDHDVLELSEDQDELRLSCCDTSRPHRFALACEHEGDDTFSAFEGAAALPLGLAERGFWLRVPGPHPRVLHCILRGGAR